MNRLNNIISFFLEPLSALVELNMYFMQKLVELRFWKKLGRVGGSIASLLGEAAGMFYSRIEAVLSGASRLNQNRKRPRTRSTNPPKFGEYLLYFFLSKQDRTNLLGDLEEDFREVQKKFGRLPAKIFYYKQVVCSIGPLIWRKLAKWGTIAAVEEWIRRHI